MKKQTKTKKKSQSKVKQTKVKTKLVKTKIIDSKQKTKNTIKTLIKKTKGVTAIIAEQKELTKPDPKVLIKINSFVNKINIELKKKKIDAEASIGGSVAKGTFIKDNFDADIFVKFNLTFKGKNISDVLENVLKDLKLNANKVHGSRDYFQIKEEFTYELVPVLKVTNYKEAENVADMSPLHVDYFMKKSETIQNLRDEVRITKLFMKSARVYGAESYIKGFSGHVVDLLLIKYASFLNLVKSAAKWKDEVIIDIETYHIDAKMALNSSKIYGPLIIVDPVQRTRNAAAAVSIECFNRFKERCIAFLSCTSDDFFALPDFNTIIDEKIGNTKKADIYIFNITPLEGKRDVIGSKILKIKEHIETQAKEAEFNIIWSEWEFNEKNSRICFAFEDKKLPDTRVIKGPPLEMDAAVDRFKKVHRNTHNEKGNIYATETRRFLLVKSFLTFIIKDEYIKDKCKELSFIEME